MARLARHLFHLMAVKHYRYRIVVERCAHKKLAGKIYWGKKTALKPKEYLTILAVVR